MRDAEASSYNGKASEDVAASEGLRGLRSAPLVSPPEDQSRRPGDSCTTSETSTEGGISETSSGGTRTSLGRLVGLKHEGRP